MKKQYLAVIILTTALGATASIQAQGSYTTGGTALGTAKGDTKAATLTATTPGSRGTFTLNTKGGTRNGLTRTNQVTTTNVTISTVQNNTITLEPNETLVSGLVAQTIRAG
jgi:hypothetical protein